ncbi:type IV toxin-antitoxin system AbiEi family antitoxin [Microbacterium insulae]|uniref:Type IV toxin-antitoxin system AbiEi family antitoxin n=1 Tax=Microbacterium insulae TaxID=483014 RepID=A0ABW3AJF1_9MICO
MLHETAVTLLTRLDEYGLRVYSGYSESPISDLEPGIPERATVAHERGKREMTLLYAPTMTMTDIGRFGSDFLTPRSSLVMGTRINERSADMFRRHGVNFLDEAGNAYVDFEGVHIDVRGRRNESKPAAKEFSGIRSTNLFSTKRSQVIFALMTWPDLLSAPLRSLAHTAGVSLGQAQETLTLLQEANFVSDTVDRKLYRGKELFDQWTAAYPTGLGAPSRVRGFSGEVQQLDTDGESSLVVSGEAAVPNQLRPQTLTVYVDRLSPRMIAANRWRTDREPNIFVRTRFWRDPAGDPLPGTITLAPPTLIYADLLASGDGRQAEVAEQLRQSDDRLQRL